MQGLYDYDSSWERKIARMPTSEGALAESQATYFILVAYYSLHTAEFSNSPGFDTRIFGFQGLFKLFDLCHPQLCMGKVFRSLASMTEGISRSIREVNFKISPPSGFAHYSVKIYELVAYHLRV